MAEGTRQTLLGTQTLTGDVAPSRSPGTLGWNDAADPEWGICEAGDTPGVAGMNGDAGEPVCNEEAMSCYAEVPVVAVDLDAMRRTVYAAAYAEAANAAATRGFASAEIDLGDQRKIEADARNRAQKMMELLQEAMAQGPQAVQAFLVEQERRKEQARAALQKKIDEALAAGANWDKAFGWTVKALSVLKFGSTVTIKVVSMFTGPAGLGIDIAYSGAQAGIDHVYKGKKDETLLGVVAEETGENLLQELGEWANEAVADKLMTREEANLFKGTIGNLKGNTEKLTQQIEALEERLAKALKAEQSRKAANLAKQHAKKLAKLKELRLKTAKSLLGKGAKATAKKAAGKTLSLVFLASEVKEAWGDMADEWRASD